MHEIEFRDLAHMINNANIFKKKSIGDHFTWSNKQSHGTNYSRIYKVIANMAWLQQNVDTTLHIMEP